MSDEQNKYYKIITNKHTSLIVNLLISSINIMSRLSFPVFGSIDSNIAGYNYLCFEQPLFFLKLYKQPSLIVAEERHHRVKNRARELPPERGRVVVLRQRMLCLDDSKPYYL